MPKATAALALSLALALPAAQAQHAACPQAAEQLSEYLASAKQRVRADGEVRVEFEVGADGRAQALAVQGSRAYLNPVRDRANLEVRGGCRALRVVFEGARAVGVEVDDADGRRTIAADEVVLCAGGIGTPHLLLVSGVGPAGRLRRLGIPVVRDAPGVGRAFSDHPDLSVGWRSRRDLVDTSSPETFTKSSFQRNLQR